MYIARFINIFDERECLREYDSKRQRGISYLIEYS